ncbi:ribulose-phosphate 3-epimerase [Coprinopsis cinerea okayama7|uniref:Ribulose-phosphate 3-epimerase n=1 Tax=Coprinopsis cinerea (strain Okayama-7 / 130 / ATCC MYA-4618 / FGSC 9003) TaxID=240176 RepID=A8N160_COPC7|nr:ribulose-phosphate 3-epimerase [Coprinopsis cinerea okayama7\|eukprot:XP_001828610.2 ribulose-phosphate 3-epimerase [Coprinopsis cinerea okayama7\
MPRAIISPSVLASDFGQLTAECKRMIKGGAEWLHMDVMDGHFVPNITMGAPILSCVRKGIPDIFMDCHMMVAQPERWVDDIADAGGAMYCFHIEATSDPIALIHQIHKRNMKAGVAISPDTPSTAITDEIGQLADMLLVMTVYPGRGGQKFIERCVPKVSELRARFPDKDIEVDGGVGPKTIDVCAEAGSNVIVAGTAIFGADDPPAVIKSLKETVEAAQAKFAAARAQQQKSNGSNGANGN